MFTPQPFKPKLHLSRAKPITAADLYPDLTPEEQARAEYFLLRYLKVMQRIFEETEKLTASGESDTL